MDKASRRFWSFYEALSRAIQTQADKQLSLLKADTHHPSLVLKKIGQRKGEEVWSARITLNYRALAYKRDFGFVWVWIGEHKVYDDLIS